MSIGVGVGVGVGVLVCMLGLRVEGVRVVAGCVVIIYISDISLNVQQSRVQNLIVPEASSMHAPQNLRRWVPEACTGGR